MLMTSSWEGQKMSEVRPVSWKLHSWKGVWKKEHWTRDGRTTLCGVTVPKSPWAISFSGNNRRWKACKNCDSILEEPEE